MFKCALTNSFWKFWEHTELAWGRKMPTHRHCVLFQSYGKYTVAIHHMSGVGFYKHPISANSIKNITQDFLAFLNVIHLDLKRQRLTQGTCSNGQYMYCTVAAWLQDNNSGYSGGVFMTPLPERMKLDAWVDFPRDNFPKYVNLSELEMAQIKLSNKKK